VPVRRAGLRNLKESVERKGGKRPYIQTFFGKRPRKSFIINRGKGGWTPERGADGESGGKKRTV